MYMYMYKKDLSYSILRIALSRLIVMQRAPVRNFWKTSTWQYICLISTICLISIFASLKGGHLGQVLLYMHNFLQGTNNFIINSILELLCQNNLPFITTRVFYGALSSNVYPSYMQMLYLI